MTEPLLRVGVVADTHVPDRVATLHPDLLAALRAARVERILHAGDISVPAVIAELSTIALVDMARGNRDWDFRSRKGWVNQLELAGVRVALMHGHGNWFNYVFDKFFYIAQGYRFSRYRTLLLRAARGAKVIVFGHTHHAENFWIKEQLIFNPGSAWRGFHSVANPSWGLLSFYTGGRVEANIYELPGYRVVKGEWVKIS